MRRFAREYLFQLIVGLTVTSTVACAAIINKYWSWPNAVVGGVLLLSGLLYLMERAGLGPSVKSRVRDWLDSSGYSIRSVSDNNEFHFMMTDSIGMQTHILQVKAGDSILIAAPKNIASPQQFAAYNSLTAEQRVAFWRGVRLELLKYGAQFSDLTLDGEGVTFSENVPVSRGLTGTEFLKRVLFVRTGTRLYWELMLALYDSSPSLQPAEDASVKT
jgi:hypothetical protein